MSCGGCGSGGGDGGGGGGGGDGDPYLDCQDGTGDYADCVGTCFTSDYLAWLGDGYCDDGTWGLVFTCDEYGNDCGDCGTGGDPYGACDDDGGGGGDGDGIGESCTDSYGYAGLYDCQLQCVSEDIVNSWLGDGLCDDGSWGVYLDCEEFAFDNGDCDGGGGGGGEDCEASGGLSSWTYRCRSW